MTDRKLRFKMCIRDREKDDVKEKTVRPPKLYDLTTLPREANRMFGYTAQPTLDAVQEMSEPVSYTHLDVYKRQGVISGNTAVDATEAITRIVDALEDMELGDLFLLSMETMLISVTMHILSIIITVILYGRMIEIYRASRSTAFYPKAVRGHFGNPALASR